MISMISIRIVHSKDTVESCTGSGFLRFNLKHSLTFYKWESHLWYMVYLRNVFRITENKQTKNETMNIFWGQNHPNSSSPALSFIFDVWLAFYMVFGCIIFQKQTMLSDKRSQWRMQCIDMQAVSAKKIGTETTRATRKGLRWSECLIAPLSNLPSCL